MILLLVAFTSFDEIDFLPRLMGFYLILYGITAGALSIILGFVCLALVQIGRAGVDTAELTQQMLQVARKQLKVSERALNQSTELKQSFTALADRSAGEAATAAGGSYADKPANGSDDPPAAQLKDKVPNAETSKRSALGVHEYKGETIEIVKGKYVYNGTPFPSMERAKSYIDQYGGSS